MRSKTGGGNGLGTRLLLMYTKPESSSSSCKMHVTGNVTWNTNSLSISGGSRNETSYPGHKAASQRLAGVLQLIWQTQLPVGCVQKVALFVQLSGKFSLVIVHQHFVDNNYQWFLERKGFHYTTSTYWKKRSKRREREKEERWEWAKVKGWYQTVKGCLFSNKSSKTLFLTCPQIPALF